MQEDNHSRALAAAEGQGAGHALRAHAARPAYHFTPPFGWMNDPNGLCQWGGQYHLFYQHNPYGTQWARMHWGHAVSRDLVRWTDLPEALAPSEPYDQDERGGCYSGSATECDGQMALLYTGCVHRGGAEVQTQNLALSPDGVHFSKYAGNPVIAAPPEGASEQFRDPKVWRQGDGWFLVVCNSVAGRGCVQLYRSADLVRWEHRGVLLTAAEGEGWMWECPDFFALDGRWMLTVSALGSTVGENLWFVGDCDLAAVRFTVTRRGTLDAGKDFYAAQTFRDAQGRRLMMAWADSRSLRPGVAPDAFTAAAGYCGHMTLPRRIRLTPEGEPLFSPAEELAALRQAPVSGTATLRDGETCPLCASIPAALECEITLWMPPAGLEQVELCLRHDADHETQLAYRQPEGLLLLNRNRTDDFHTGVIAVPVEPGAELRLRLYLDRTSLEVFIGHGEKVLSANLFPQSGTVGLSLRAVGGDGLRANWQVWAFKP